MSGQKWSKDEARRIVKRVIVEGDLVLQTPAHLGNGDGDEVTDMPLLMDAVDEKSPLLTGASLAGALRSYLRNCEVGYGQALPGDDEAAQKIERERATARLFGGFRADDWGEQSALIVEDARGYNRFDQKSNEPVFDLGVEVRDGVKISGASRTAEEKKLYDMRLWPAGTIFTLRCELVLRQQDNERLLKAALATALGGLTDGGITLGARKRRGHGRVSVAQWRLREFDLMEAEQLCDWIEQGGKPLAEQAHEKDLQKLGTAWGEKQDAREQFEIAAEFTVNDSLLIRSGGRQDDTGPDMVHLKAHQADGSVRPIVSGTSLAGALRARALKIAKTIGVEKADELIGEMFGPDMEAVQQKRRAGDREAQPHASRVLVDERVVTGARADLVQSRVSIDRFTGGARETALFNEQPAYGGQLEMHLRLLRPQEKEIGLLLLLLKDLWTSDLAVGGESSAGRGRLTGQWAKLTWRKGQGEIVKWEIREEVEKDGSGNQPDRRVLKVSGGSGKPPDPKEELNGFVAALKPPVTGGAQ